MTRVKGFRVIDVPLGNGLASHQLFIKEHNDNKDTGGKSKTLFVGNVDYCGERSHEEIDLYLRSIFDSYGNIESVSISKYSNAEADDFMNRKGRKTRFAHVVFDKKSSMKTALAASDDSYLEICKHVSDAWGYASTLPSGLGKRTRREEIEKYKYENELEQVSELKENVAAYMRDFEEEEELARRERERKLNEVDEDGFMPVKNRKKVKVGAVAANRDNDKRGTGKQRSRGDKKDKKTTELKNFYRFQIKDEKKEKLLELRRKFEEDKSRIAKMKQNRKFNPFAS